MLRADDVEDDILGSITIFDSSKTLRGKILIVLVAVSPIKLGIIFTVLGLLQISKVFVPDGGVIGVVATEEDVLVLTVFVTVLSTGTF